jgi:DNA-binding SARP family transcriptional activator
MAPYGSLTIRLFGRLDVCADTSPVRIAGRHAQALIALLALRPRPRLRDSLGADLWPESNGPSAGQLRQALWLLRSSFATAGIAPDDWLDADQDSLGIRADARLNLDTETFERLATSGLDGDDERAIRVYRGDLLESLGHECFAAERERLSDMYEDLLARVAEARLARADLDGARQAATELLERDPLREEAHAALISVYGRTGTRSQVVRQYRRVCTILRNELAVAPLPETDAAYRAALARAATRSAARAADMPYERAPFAPLLVTSA